MPSSVRGPQRLNDDLCVGLKIFCFPRTQALCPPTESQIVTAAHEKVSYWPQAEPASSGQIFGVELDAQVCCNAPLIMFG